jgi:hypothetical protein
MATRSIIRFAKREEGVSFNEHPDTWDAQFYAGFGVAEDMECIFVGKPQKLIEKYKPKTNG